ncbi:MAG: hypothetical protein NC543_07975 [bacterium]|nr:hypothetical protein [bacterium]MCM1373516.1 hypothetical protein [Muribaculum sp.]
MSGYTRAKYVIRGLICVGVLLLTSCGQAERESASDVPEASVSTQVCPADMDIPSLYAFFSQNVVLAAAERPGGRPAPDMQESQVDRWVWLADMNIHPLYAAFLRGEIRVANPFAEEDELSFFDERDYEPEQTFTMASKSFSLVDVNGDGEPELIFRMEDSPSELVYILGVLGDELTCFDVFETHTTHMSVTVYDNGIVCWGQNYDGSEDIYYSYDSDGKSRELLHFVGTEDDLASELEYEYYYLDGDGAARFSLDSVEEYERLIAPYEGEYLEWFRCDAFADIPRAESIP